ncbi:MAG: hypothetical protein ACR2N9_08865, partial [Acidimicrobiia bacterium]
MKQTDPIVEYRIRVLSIGLIVSWLGLIVVGIWAITAEDIDWTAIGTLLGVVFVTLVIVSVAPWRTLMRKGIADWFLLPWTFIMMGTILILELSRNERPSGIGFLIVTFFAAATLRKNSSLVAVGVIATAGYGFALYEWAGIESASPLLSFL